MNFWQRFKLNKLQKKAQTLHDKRERGDAVEILIEENAAVAAVRITGPAGKPRVGIGQRREGDRAESRGPRVGSCHGKAGGAGGGFRPPPDDRRRARGSAALRGS